MNDHTNIKDFIMNSFTPSDIKQIPPVFCITIKILVYGIIAQSHMNFKKNLDDVNSRFWDNIFQNHPKG